jgi:hypothetical protein
MKNTTLAMVAALAAVTMLSAVLSVAPMQQAIAGNGDGDGDGDGGNSIKIKQSNECENTMPNSCSNFAEVTETTQEIIED